MSVRRTCDVADCDEPIPAGERAEPTLTTSRFVEGLEAAYDLCPTHRQMFADWIRGVPEMPPSAGRSAEPADLARR